MPAIKIVTCCYCGAREALVLASETRHELACGNCGAPLRQLKMLRKAAVPVTAPAATPTRPEPKKHAQKRDKFTRNRPKKKSKFSKLRSELIEEVWDFIEDIFD